MSDGTAPPPAEVAATVRRVLEEDVGGGDLTAALVPAAAQAGAEVVCRERGVLCGRAWFDEVYRQLDPGVTVTWEAEDGARLEPGQRVCTLRGPARALLTGERSALNLLQTLSGTATAARRHAEVLRGTRTRLLDTRKTLPGLRAAQKYAVRCGGGCNHRMGLYDGILVKENHIAAAGSISAAVEAARRLHPGVPLEVEVENLAELDEALACGVERIMLDDFAPGSLREAVRRSRGRARLEVSGSLTLEALRGLAATGVDFVSVGALTKHLHALDFAMRFTQGEPGEPDAAPRRRGGAERRRD